MSQLTKKSLLLSYDRLEPYILIQNQKNTSIIIYNRPKQLNAFKLTLPEDILYHLKLLKIQKYLFQRNFCDASASFLLPRLNGNIGKYLALTSKTLVAEDVLFSGIATHFVPSNLLSTLREACFQFDTAVEILEVLKKEGSKFSLEMIDQIMLMVPICVFCKQICSFYNANIHEKRKLRIPLQKIGAVSTVTYMKYVNIQTRTVSLGITLESTFNEHIDLNLIKYGIGTAAIEMLNNGIYCDQHQRMIIEDYEHCTKRNLYGYLFLLNAA
ncbi:hypothetical protein EDC94DRAFT_587924 [Helicostylum pulchrum]|nr:hypothetical protein EDC94DRAFT_587924 [Helicostylum pulchrum]